MRSLLTSTMKPRGPLKAKPRFFDCITGNYQVNNPHHDGRLDLKPLDDRLLSGIEYLPSGKPGGLYHIAGTVQDYAQSYADAVLAFPGTFIRFGWMLPPTTAWVVNVTASITTVDHTHKVLMADSAAAAVADVITLGGDAVAVHVNVYSRWASEMLQTLGAVAAACRQVDPPLPLLALMYPRGETDQGEDYNHLDVRDRDCSEFAHIVQHCVAIGAEAGADLIKTIYTGSPQSFATVVKAAAGVPVVIAGEALASPWLSLTRLQEAFEGGAAGPAYGRNTYNAPYPSRTALALHCMTHGGMSAMQAISTFGLDVDAPIAFELPGYLMQRQLLDPPENWRVLDI